MAEARSLPLLSQYSDVFTRLHEGKNQFIGYGIDRIALNRLIIDAAESTSQPDLSALLAMVDFDKVDGGSASEKQQDCTIRLNELISLQEEVNTLQKVAREKGIAGGLLTIVGQASLHSPEDHGASVIHQLSELMDDGKSAPRAALVDGVPAGASESSEVPALQAAANDAAEISESQGLTAWLTLAQQNWQVLTIDILFCLGASFFAIHLVS